LLLKGRKKARELTLSQGHNDLLKRETLKEIWIQAQRNTTKAAKSHKVTPHQPTWTTTTATLQESSLKDKFFAKRQTDINPSP
jgi:hypothetical protein